MSKTEKFIKKCINKFGNKFDYTNINYIDSTIKIEIKCNLHGNIFHQTPSEHLRGKNGCNSCTRNPKVTTEYFINKSKSIHGDKYDYSICKYNGANTKVSIICKEHGVFKQLPNNHYTQNCPKCYNKNLSNTDFTSKASDKHINKYDYSLVDYDNSKSKITIICPEHGEFNQIPNDHLTGKGCPKCGFVCNKIESEIKEFISSLNLNFDENTRKIISPLELDIYIPSHKLAIELNGLYWHSELYKDKNYHINKTELCEKLGIQLIHVFEDEWVNKQNIVKSRLENILGLTKNKIYGRKTQIKEITSKISSNFLTNNHIQGNVNASVKLGLFYNDELVSVMTFGALRKSMGGKSVIGKYEMYRFCNKLDTTVIGGANKLLHYFIQTYKPIEIISYADRRWSQGNLYNNLNFKFIRTTKPSYFYLVNEKREHRFKYRKNILINEGFDVKKTEHQIMLDRKLYRIYDCGVITYKLSF